MQIIIEIKDKWGENGRRGEAEARNLVDAGAVNVGKHELVDQHQEIGDAPGSVTQGQLREFGITSLHDKSSNELVYYDLKERKQTSMFAFAIHSTFSSRKN